MREILAEIQSAAFMARFMHVMALIMGGIIVLGVILHIWAISTLEHPERFIDKYGFNECLGFGMGMVLFILFEYIAIRNRVRLDEITEMPQ